MITLSEYWESRKNTNPTKVDTNTGVQVEKEQT